MLVTKLVSLAINKANQPSLKQIQRSMYHFEILLKYEREGRREIKSKSEFCYM